MTDPIPARKRGRPPKFLGSEERISRSLRLMPHIESKIREAAENNHRSLAEELEFRVMQTVEGVCVEFSEAEIHDLSVAAKERGISLSNEIRRRTVNYKKRISVEDLSEGELANLVEERVQAAHLDGEFAVASSRLEDIRADLQRAENVIVHLTNDLERTKVDIEDLGEQLAKADSEGERLMLSDMIASRKGAIRYLDESRSDQVSRTHVIRYALSEAEGFVKQIMDKRSALLT